MPYHNESIEISLSQPQIISNSIISLIDAVQQWKYNDMNMKIREKTFVPVLSIVKRREFGGNITVMTSKTTT